MCLMTKDLKIGKQPDGIGYKVMVKNDEGSYRSMFASILPLFTPFLGKTVAKDEESYPIMINYRRGISYPAGYHIFTTLENAQLYHRRHLQFNNLVIVKVKYSDVVAKGYQNIQEDWKHYRRTCIVAKTMEYIEESPKG